MTMPTATLGRPPNNLFGGWENGLLIMMALLYVAGAVLNPSFFGSTDALQALLRDSARYAVMAVGMTFVIANKDIDLSVGSAYGLIAVVFSVFFNDANLGMGVLEAIAACLVLGALIGLANGVLVTFLRVPAFIATLTMLLIGRGFILGLTGG
jgi:ribose transport system permease protein